MNTLETIQITHPFFQANAWLLMTDTHSVLVDTASNESADATRVLDAIRDSKRKLHAVVLSHGHPDIWLGVKAIREAHPDVPIYAADARIVDDIVQMGEMLDGAGMLGKTPELSPKRFDYRAVIRVLGSPELVIPGKTPVKLAFEVTEKPSEHTRLTTIWHEESRTLFVADLAYNGVHSWAGMGVDRSALENWRTILDDLVRRRGQPGVRVLCGHGEPTDANVLLAQRSYLETLVAAIDADANEAAMRDRMKAAFPHHRGVEFQLAMTVRNRDALRH